MQTVDSGENVAGIRRPSGAAKAVTDKPSIICLRTVIAFPAPPR